MKQNRRLPNQIFLLVFSIILITGITGVTNEDINNDINGYRLRGIDKGDIPYSKASIRSFKTNLGFQIIGDESLRNLSQQNAWNGNGTKIDPFIIENYNFIGSNELVRISGVFLFLEIRNCHFKNAETALYIGLSNNTKIVNNTFVNNLDPVQIVGSNNINITSNNIVANQPSAESYGGIFVFLSSNITITQNKINQNIIGIQLHRSDHINVLENMIDNNKKDGIWIVGSPEVNIIGNAISNHQNAKGGIYVDDYSSPDPRQFSENILIQNNTLDGNNYGVYLSRINAFSITENLIRNNWIGGAIFNSSRIGVLNNTIYNNERYAIQIFHTNSSKVKHNTFISNKNYLVDFTELGGNKIALNEKPLISQVYNEGPDDTNFSLNYWDDHLSPDLNGDKIIDTAYLIEGNANNSDENPVSEIPTLINEPFVSKPTLISPIGFEAIKGNYLINWTEAKVFPSGGVVEYRLYIGIDTNNNPKSVENWTQLIANYTSTTYDLDISVINDDWYDIKIVAETTNGLKSEDTNDHPFSIGIDRLKDQLRGYAGGGIPGLEWATTLGILFLFFLIRKRKTHLQ